MIELIGDKKVTVDRPYLIVYKLQFSMLMMKVDQNKMDKFNQL